MMEKNIAEGKMVVTEYSGDAKIIASGTFLLKENNDNIRLHINMRPELNYEMDVRITFKNDSEIKDVKLQIGDVNSALIEYIVVNADSPDGNGTLSPLKIGSFKDVKKEVYLNCFFSRPTTQNPRKFTYSIYMEG